MQITYEEVSMTAKYGVKRRLAILGTAMMAASTTTFAAEKPNILVIWGMILDSLMLVHTPLV